MEAITVQIFENNVQYIKYRINREIAKHFFKGTLCNSLSELKEISETIITGPKPSFRCCIYKEREIVQDRVRYAIEPIEDGIITVLPSACDECPINRYVVTEVCRGCIGHRCISVCPANAITIVEHRAYIDQSCCIECGNCRNVCPFNAISDVQRPCVRACRYGSVKVDENRKAKIDQISCVSCGECVQACPFGAVVDKSFVLEVLRLLNTARNTSKYRVYAVLGNNSFSRYEEEKKTYITNLSELGFFAVIEAFDKSMSQTIEWIQKMDADAKIVFVGYDIIHKSKMKKMRFREELGYVLTNEEMWAILDSKNM